MTVNASNTNNFFYWKYWFSNYNIIWLCICFFFCILKPVNSLWLFYDLCDFIQIDTLTNMLMPISVLIKQKTTTMKILPFFQLETLPCVRFNKIPFMHVNLKDIKRNIILPNNDGRRILVQKSSVWLQSASSDLFTLLGYSMCSIFQYYEYPEHFYLLTD